MRVVTAGQTNQFAANASANRFVHSNSAADIVIVAAWSATGLALAALVALSLSGPAKEIFDAAIGLAG